MRTPFFSLFMLRYPGPNENDYCTIVWKANYISAPLISKQGTNRITSGWDQIRTWQCAKGDMFCSAAFSNVRNNIPRNL